MFIMDVLDVNSKVVAIFLKISFVKDSEVDNWSSKSNFFPNYFF